MNFRNYTHKGNYFFPKNYHVELNIIIIKKNTCRYHYQTLDHMIYSSWDIEQNILKLTTLSHFLPFSPPKNPPESKFKKMEKFAGDIIILNICTKIYNICSTVPEIWSETDITLCHFRQFFALLSTPPPSLLIPKIKILKTNEKNPRDTILLYKHVYHQWRSYHIWFLKRTCS